MSEAFGSYPSPDERDAELSAIVDALGAELSIYGQSVEGRPLRAVKLKGEGGGEQAVSVCANIHGIEWIGNRVAHGFLRALGTDLGKALLERADVWVFPCLNPDGYEETFRCQGQGRVREMRKNANKVDLNRNFPMPFGAEPHWWPTSGSYVEDDATHRGKAPLSEPETRCLVEALDDIKPWASANMHSFMGTMIPPKTPDRSESRAYIELFKAFRASQPRIRYRILRSQYFDVFTGEQEDHQHYAHGTWAMCVETFPILKSIGQHLRAPSAFWRFNPRDPQLWVDNDVAGLFGYLLAALDRDRPVHRPDAITPRATWRLDG